MLDGLSAQNSKRRVYLVVSVQWSNASLEILKERTEEVSYSVEKDYVDDSKSILAEIKGEDIDITSDSTMKMNSKYCEPSP